MWSGPQLFTRLHNLLHGSFVARLQAGSLDVGRRVIAMMAGESLLNLGAAAVAMHVAKAANIHKDVKLELLAGMEAT